MFSFRRRKPARGASRSAPGAGRAVKSKSASLFTAGSRLDRIAASRRRLFRSAIWSTGSTERTAVDPPDHPALQSPRHLQVPSSLHAFVPRYRRHPCASPSRPYSASGAPPGSAAAQHPLRGRRRHRPHARIRSLRPPQPAMQPAPPPQGRMTVPLRRRPLARTAPDVPADAAPEIAQRMLPWSPEPPSPAPVLVR